MDLVENLRLWRRRVMEFNEEGNRSLTSFICNTSPRWRGYSSSALTLHSWHESLKPCLLQQSRPYFSASTSGSCPRPHHKTPRRLTLCFLHLDGNQPRTQ